MVRRDRRDAEDRIRRVVVGSANLFLAGMLVYAVRRFQSSIGDVYGNRFFYVPAAMLAIAVWRAVAGLLILLGRRRGA